MDETGLAAHTTRRRAAGPDPWGVEREGPQQDVDVIGDAGLLGARRPVFGGQHLRAGSAENQVLVVAQPDGHRATVACRVSDC